MVQFKRAYRFLLVLSSLGLFVYPGAAKMEIPDSLRIRIQKTKPDTSRVNLLNEMATDWMTRDLETAGLLSTEAVELARKSNYYRGLHKALMNRGNYLLYGARYSEARKDYQRALNLPVFIPQKEAAGIYDLLASASFLQGLYGSAIYFARQAVRRHRLDKGSEDYIRSLENLGSLFSQTGDYDSAILQYAKGVESIENNLRTLEVQTPAYKNALRQKAGMIRLIALSWYKKGNSRFANNELQKAIPMAVIGEDKGLEAKLYSDKAMIDHSSGMPEKALEYYLKALKIYEDNDESLQIAIIWSRIGDIYQIGRASCRERV